ncbi:MAG: MBL fold metallo-hydrolase [Bacteroidales bacterium]|nr:MBL fold metallo-hydrolase [Candidatus Scybalousia scybalohippi]
MFLKVLGSGSDGNCYLLNNNGRTLIIDVGISMREIKTGLNFDLMQIDGIICSHKHMDHFKSVKDFEKMGFDVWKPFENAENKKQSKQLGVFKVTCFDVPHDGIENRGFLIECDGQKMLYLTDFEYCKYTFKNLNVNHILVECNYIENMVDKNSNNYSHILKGHAELNTTANFIKENNTNNLKNVFICHLSKDNSNKRIMVNEILKCVNNDCKVDVASKGKEWELWE